MYHDQYSDKTGKKIHKCISNFPELKDFFEKISSETLAKASDSCFAIPEMRLFPCHTKEHTEASLAFLDTFPQDLPKTAQDRLGTSVEAFGVDFTTKTAQVEHKVIERFLIPENKKYPVNSKEQAKIAEEYILEHIEIPLERRMQMAKNLCKFASELDYKASHDIRCLGLEAEYDPQYASDFITHRIDLVALDEDRENLRKLACIAREADGNDGVELLKIASAIELIDARNSLFKNYGKLIPNPLNSLFKQASDISSPANVESITLNNRRISFEQLDSIKKEEFSDIVGSNIANEIYDGESVNLNNAKLVIESLPTDVKQELENNLKEYTHG